MSNTTTLIFIRHGETEWNTEQRAQGSKNSPLTPKGIKQAENTGRILEKIKIDAVYSSPLERAYITAGIIAEGKNLEIIKSENLKEINLGPWEGKTLEEVKNNDPRQFENFRRFQDRFFLEGAETFSSVQKRVVSEIKSILEKNKGKTILAVSHGIAIKTAEVYFKEKNLSDLYRTPVLENGKFMVLRKTDSGITVSDDISLL